MLKYTAVRFLLFAGVTAVLWLIGIRVDIWVLLALGLAISGLISFFLLNRTRDDASSSLVGAFRRMNDRIDSSARAEDEAEIGAGDGSSQPDGPPTDPSAAA